MTQDSQPGASPTPPRDSRQLTLFDESELDIADYLRDEADDGGHQLPNQSLLALAIGAVGVVYGDIGTSPLYAFREALRPISHDGVARAEVLGLLSLVIWTLIINVSIKYLVFLLRVDNRGEGGILSLYTLTRLAIGRRSVPVLVLAIMGAALFYGDATITPAISVLSAVEGTELILPAMETWVVPITLGILLALFLVQRKGTATIAAAFGPITVVWFLAMGGLGIAQILANPSILAAFSPVWGVEFLLTHKAIAFTVLGAIFLAVTGAEALYADLGHFGRKPIILAWFSLIFPALILNYLGQGALVLADPSTIDNPFFKLCPPSLLPVLVFLATAATVIAAQAGISGAYSMTRAAMQLGLLPRMTIRHTSHGQSGQIYIGTVNWALLFGVLCLVVVFDNSTALAAAYGIAVIGTMIMTTSLSLIYVVNQRILPLPLAVLFVSPVWLIEFGYLTANLSKVTDGGYVPLMLALTLGVAMWSWWRGSQIIMAKSHKQLIALDGFARSMAHSSVHVIPGTAFFLTPDPTVVPSALLHNLKHNRVLHEQNVLLTVETLRIPVAPMDERATYERIDDRFGRVTLRFGFMETPNVSRAMAYARKAGLEFNVMTSSFFLGRRRPVVTGPITFERVLDSIYALLSRFSADPSDYFHLPRDRVVELGERVAV